MISFKKILKELKENTEADRQFRSQLLKVYNVILKEVCQKNVDVNVDLAWKNIKHLYGKSVGNSDDIEYDKDVVEKYGIHDTPWLAKIDLSDIFSSDFISDYELRFNVVKEFYGGSYYEPENYIVTSIAENQSEIMKKFFSEIDQENLNNKNKFREVVYDYICEKFPKHKRIFLHELVHLSREEMNEMEVRFQELIFVLEENFDTKLIKKKFKNFENFKNWFFGEFAEYKSSGTRIDLSDLEDSKRNYLVDKLHNYWKFIS